MRSAGTSGTNAYVELSCKDGSGYLLAGSNPLHAGSSVQALPCIAVSDSAALQCQLQNRAKAIAAVDGLMAKSGAECTITNRRLVGTAKNGDSLYEYACSSERGYILRTDVNGEVVGGIECGEPDAKTLGGCKLTKSAP
jgi:hypothetical protein